MKKLILSYFLAFIIGFGFSYLYENRIKGISPGQCFKAIENFCHEHGLPKHMCESGLNTGNPLYDAY